MGFRFPNPLGRSNPEVSYSQLIAQREDPDSPRLVRVVRPRRRRAKLLLLGALAVVVLLGAALVIWLYGAFGSDDAPEPRVAVVTANRLNCRSQPSPAAGVVYVAMRTQQLLVTGENGSWRQVRVSGKQCWVSGEFLSVPPPGRP